MLSDWDSSISTGDASGGSMVSLICHVRDFHRNTNVMQGAGQITIVNTIGERLHWARSKRGLKQRQLALMAGVATSTIGNVESGVREKPRELNAIAAALGVLPHWLETGRGEWESPSGWLGATGIPIGRKDDQHTEEAGQARASRRVPVVGTARMGDDGFYDEISSMPGAGDGHIEIATSDENAYCLRVRGNSMAPAIRDGWYVLIEPNGLPAVGEYVLLKLHDGRKMVKELLFQRSGSVEIMSVNGEERRTLYPDELEAMQAVAAVVSPSKWKPD